MKSHQTQLQEQESLIRQRRLYLEGQQNQIQRNLELLKNQATTISQNKAEKKSLEKSIAKLKTDEQKLISEIATAAENKAKAEINTYRDGLKAELAKLRISIKSTRESLNISERKLAVCDDRIIEAENIAGEIHSQIKELKKRRQESERLTGSQAKAYADLTADIEKSEERLRDLKNAKIALEQEKAGVLAEVEELRKEKDSLADEISDLNTQLKKVSTELGSTISRLEEVSSIEKAMREDLAKRELDLQRKEKKYQPKDAGRSNPEMMKL